MMDLYRHVSISGSNLDLMTLRSNTVLYTLDLDNSTYTDEGSNMTDSDIRGLNDLVTEDDKQNEKLRSDVYSNIKGTLCTSTFIQHTVGF